MATEGSSPDKQDHTTSAIPEPDDGFELQVAIDALSGGSTDALKTYLARKAGVDPDQYEIRSKPFTADLAPDAKLEYIGRLDDVNPPGRRLSAAHSGSRPNINLDHSGAPYIYTPLDPKLEFRLLKLSPPDEHGVVRTLQLETFSVEDAPEYLCLSYVWGDSNKFIPVNCSGGTVKITQNLFHSLQICFARFSTDWLWADGICINQNGLEERAHQVLLMGKVFQNATMVVANPGHYRYAFVGENKQEETVAGVSNLLGDLSVDGNTHEIPMVEDTEASGSTRPLIQDPADSGTVTDRDNAQAAVSIMTYLCRIWESWNEYEIKSDKEWERHGLPDPLTDEGLEIWNNLLGFWHEDWYFRTWVLQEVVLAKKLVVLYGDAAISLDAVMDFWLQAKRHGLPKALRLGPLADYCTHLMNLSPVSSFKLLRDKREKLRAEAKDETESNSESGEATQHRNNVSNGTTSSLNGETTGLLDLLALSRTNLATDARDKIYGLLSLTNDSIAQSIVPNYSDSNTVAKLYIDIASKFVELGQGKDLLHYAGADQQVGGLPSWVPDVSITPVNISNNLMKRLTNAIP
jgi:hypothetical protein